MRIFVYGLREYDEKAYFDRFCREYGCQYRYTSDYPSLHNAELAEGCDALNIITNRMDGPLLERFHQLGIRYLATRTIGYEHIDLEKARELGMRVTSVTYSPNSVANYAIMLMLMACRNITHILERRKLQDFSLKGKMGRELSSCTVGVIGTGRIGRAVIEHLSGFGCRLLAASLYKDSEVEKYAEYVELDRLLRESDIITLHAPSDSGTHRMIDSEAIQKMKDGVILVNTARGTLIDTQALIEGLDSGKIGYAALDVIENEGGLYYFDRMGEPLGNRDLAILGSYPNVILSPHTAFYTDEAVSNMVENSIRGLCAFENGTENPFEVK